MLDETVLKEKERENWEGFDEIMDPKDRGYGLANSSMGSRDFGCVRDSKKVMRMYRME